MLKIKNLGKNYKKKEVLKNLNLEVNEGSCVGILGLNGSGKTTLLSVLAGILKSDEGEFYYNETSLFKNKKLREKLVAFIPQTNPIIEELTVYDNLLLWYDKAILKNEIEKGIIKDLGIDRFLKQDVVKLSGGMKRKLAIALAMSKKPKILLMDEVSAALDIISKNTIYFYIKEYVKKGGIVILISHDISELEICDEHYLLKDKKLEEFSYTRDMNKIIELLKE